MRIALIGAGGQLAHDVLNVAATRPSELTLFALSHSQIEVTSLASVKNALEPIHPDVVLNTSAFHKVDMCEDQPDRTLAVNAVGPANLAMVCRDLNAVLMHLSTDYVYSGIKTSPYLEEDPVDPINIYGVSKAAGEMVIRSLWRKHFIVRSSGLYGTAGPSGKGSNFVELMLRLAAEGKDIRVVDDQTLTPTCTRDLALQLVELLGTSAFGTYHATCQGQCSWFEFASEIFRVAGLVPALSPQTTAQSGARARRPRYSVLQNSSLERIGLDRMPHWKDSLAAYLSARHPGGLT